MTQKDKNKQKKTNNNKSVNYPDSITEIENLCKSNIPYIWVTTHEESRFIDELYKQVAARQRKELWTWSIHQGLISLTANMSMDAKTQNPSKALQKIEELEVSSKNYQGMIFVLKDFHYYLSQPIPRHMRDIYSSLSGAKKNVIILSPSLCHGPTNKPGVEPTLDKEVILVHYTLPDKTTILQHLNDTFADMKAAQPGKLATKQFQYTQQDIDTFATALQGLTIAEMDSALCTSMAYLGRIDEQRLLLEKQQIIKRSDILEYINQPSSLSDIGGLDLVKQYIKSYSNQFTEAARKFGVEPLRGLLLTGIAGNGKSKLSKVIASHWKLPLLRLDIGRVMSSLVGSSEMRMREAIATAIAVAPCVLWLDEIEKALSGTKSSSNTDGGTLSRVFGTLLTAMEEELKNVVVIATANDISALPPELIRRFNEVFFVDLPQAEERKEIFSIHLRQRQRDPKNFDLDQLAAVTHDFVGYEIEKVVKESIAQAFQAGLDDINTDLLEQVAQATRPIAVVMREQVTAMRDWAKNRARFASSLAVEANKPGNQVVTTKNCKKIKLNERLSNIDSFQGKEFN